MEKLKISACIIAKNASHTIVECLQSLKSFDEIILLDNESSDDTIKLAREFDRAQGGGFVKIFSSEFIGFGALKNLAISHAKNEWIFSIDSDEVLDLRALNEIKALNLESSDIIALPRANFYNGTWIKACGWYPDFVWRIFNKNFTSFNDNIVHESVIIKDGARKIYLHCGLKHYAYDNIEHLLDKMQKYSSLWAAQNAHKTSSPLKAFNHGLWTFVRNYFFKKGIFYGYKGFVISACNGLGAFFKYMKLYELRTAPPPNLCSLIITTYNQKERLAMVLDSVRDLELLPNEVIVADDGSRSDTRDLVESYARDFPCDLIHVWQEDGGFRAARIRNLAISRAKNEYIIIIDGDMILDSHFISDHLRFAKKGVLIQGSRMILDESQSAEILESKNYKKAFSRPRFKNKRSLLLSKIIYQTSVKSAKFFEKKSFIKGIRSCNMSFFKSDCVAINGFNEDFIGWGREDSEFVARFLFNGGEMRRLKFSAIAAHIWHNENSRDKIDANHDIYMDVVASKISRAKNGMAQI